MRYAVTDSSEAFRQPQILLSSYDASPVNVLGT